MSHAYCICRRPVSLEFIIFICSQAYPTLRGRAKAKWIKYLIGGLLLFVLLAIIWFPLLLMNIALTIGGISNNPIQVDVKITLGTFEVFVY